MSVPTDVRRAVLRAVCDTVVPALEHAPDPHGHWARAASEELHDAPGVWIGDGSAFPTAPGTNPMLTIMALARRTAEAITGTAAGPAPAAAMRSQEVPTWQ